MTIDLGTGDGRLPQTLASGDADRLFVGIDASAAAMVERSGRAARAKTPNLLYVRAGVAGLPAELRGVADRITVILPWGSLLAAAAGAARPSLREIRSLAQPGASLTVVLGLSAQRDGALAQRLGLPILDERYLRGPLADAYAEAGFGVCGVGRLTRDELARWPSTWARRLAHGHERAVFRIDAVAGPPGIHRLESSARQEDP